MIRINLLPTEEAQRAADQRQQLATVGLIVAVGAFLLVIGHSIQAARYAATQRRVTQVTEELQAIAGPYGDVLRIQAQQKELEEKLKVISQLEARSAGPVRMLADLSSATPDKLWLTEFAEAAGTVHMQGFSVDEQTIADFLRKLGTSTYFQNVDLEETTQVNQDGVKQKKFALKAHVNYAGATTTPAVQKPGAAPQPPKRTAALSDDPTVTASRGRITP
ncbi:MAG TPA: PilN domain-containing protein [Candidatus Eisenbacteria bacterium]|nr:PilN domain-containing protein [Candidatus Eisenbacteria bacterium]